MTDIVARLRNADYRGPMQHLRAWDELDRMHDDAADEIERLRKEVRQMKRELSKSETDVDYARFKLATAVLNEQKER